MTMMMRGHIRQLELMLLHSLHHKECSGVPVIFILQCNSKGQQKLAHTRVFFLGFYLLSEKQVPQLDTLPTTSHLVAQCLSHWATIAVIGIRFLKELHQLAIEILLALHNNGISVQAKIRKLYCMLLGSGWAKLCMSTKLSLPSFGIASLRFAVPSVCN